MMFPPRKVIGRRLGLLLSLVAALLVATSGVVLAQSTPPTYQKTVNPSTPSNVSKTGTSSVPNASPAASVNNGNFETGNLNGWTVVNQTGGGGAWFAYSGTTSPLNSLPIAPPPQGTFAATTDQGAPGSHVLYQDIALEPNARHTLSFFLYYQNHGTSFATPDTLDDTVSPNQQYRVDVLKPSADPFSVDPNDVLARIFRTEVGDPLTLAPTAKTFDLTPFAGQTVRLRFAEVDNQGPFLASTDDVKVTTTSNPPPHKKHKKHHKKKHHH
jgi:adhesin HecA-like repeat protein